MDNVKTRKFNEIRAEVLQELCCCMQSVDEKAVSAFCSQMNPEKRIYCDASGRSRLQAAGFAMRLVQMGYDAQLVGEPTSTAIRSGDILLVCSASGHTPNIVSHARNAKQMGCRLLVITASNYSELVKLGDEIIFIEAATKEDKADKAGRTLRSVQPMGSLFEQSAGLLMDMLVLCIMDKYGISPGQMRENHSNLE